MTKQTTKMVKVVGLAFDPATQDWTKETVYFARDRMEAIRWIEFNHNWMKQLRIVR